MFIHTIDPILLSIGPIAIRYYSLAYILGAVGGYLFLSYLVKRRQWTILTSTKQVEQLIMSIVIGVLIGGRVGYFIFYNPMGLITNPFQVFFIWQGGMAFHGGFLGAILGGVVWTYRNKVSSLAVADALVIPTAFALILGRVANFINGELWGTPSTVPWCVVFPTVDDMCRHPSQLYQASKNVLLLGVAWWQLSYMLGGKIAKGTMFWTFITLYGILRFIITFLRDDPSLVSGISMGQILSLLMVLIGTVMLFRR